MFLDLLRSLMVAFVLSVGLCNAGGGGGGGYVPLHERLEHAPAPTIQSMYVPLVDHLKTNYQTVAMPVCEVGKVMEAQIDMWLYQLFGLHEPTQALTIDVYVELSWKDCGLTWNPEEFDNLTQLTLPAGAIWYPDIIYYQSLHGNFEEGLFIFRESVARIWYDGTVQLGAQVLLRSFCRIQIEYFPFDTQVCNITFATWNKDMTTFKLTKRDSDDHPTVSPGGTTEAPSGDMDEGEKKGVRGHSFAKAGNGEWDVMGFPSFNTIGQFSVGADESALNNYTEVTFQLQLRRKSHYAMVYLVLPCVLLIWVSVITFFLPIECGEKVSLAITILLSLIVFLLLVAENIPRSAAGIPILGKFYTLSIALVGISVLLTAIVLNIGMKTEEIAIPLCFKSFMRLSIWWLFCFNYQEHKETHTWMSVPRPRRRKRHTDECKNPTPNDSCPVVETEAGQASSGNDGGEEKETCAKNDWRYFAMLLDRIFGVIYLILTILVTLYIYLSAPRTALQH